MSKLERLSNCEPISKYVFTSTYVCTEIHLEFKIRKSKIRHKIFAKKVVSAAL